MPAKASGPGSAVHEVGRFDGGLSWMAHPDELMQRASHALVDGDDVWVVDPVDAAGLDDRLAELGEVAGVVVLFNWHARDAGTVAARHGVPVYVPAWASRATRRIDAPVERFERALPGTELRAVRIAPHPFWREAALFRGADGTLVVPDSLGTASYFLAPGERLGVSPYQRLWPPRRALGDLEPRRVLVGHGEPVTEDAATALDDALAEARRRAPSVVLGNAGTWTRTLAAAMWR